MNHSDPGNNVQDVPKRSAVGTAKFLIFSLIGIGAFMLPVIPTEDGSRNIVLGWVIDLLGDLFATVSFADYGIGANEGVFSIAYMLALIFITISFLGTVLAWIFKPKFITENETLRNAFLSSPVYFISKAIGFVFIWMIFLGIGPDIVIASFTGDVMIGLTAGLVVIFLVLVPFMPLVTDFGLMEFIGVLIRRVVRVLFTLPGRASVDLMASWFGSSAVSIIITRTQHEKGFYTGREAAVIAVNFSFVSLPFTFVIAHRLGLGTRFLLFYLIMCITCIILGFILPRIWPLRSLPDTYLEGVGKQIHEEVPASKALALASQRAEKSGLGDVARAAGKTYLNIFMDLIPVILAWGTLAIMVAELTPIFDWISWPMGQYLRLLQVPEAMAVAPLTLLGFIDMFLPALMIGDVPEITKFIIGILSIVQIIYLVETGVLIIKSKMPLNIGKLFILFMMRTILALPIIVLLANLLF
ncbi:MAG: YjiH family protein [Oscillospiraceae bacterium]|nr:YjiH family protein [Oscillospiraceae bacterium]